MIELSRKQKLQKHLFEVLPHHPLSRIVYYATRLKGPMVVPMINWFIRTYAVNMEEAEYPEPRHYKTFNEFFTRALKAGARPIAPGDNMICSPADGTISQSGAVNNGRIIQAKGQDYSVLELLGGNQEMAAQIGDGKFITIYLAPSNYHRLHMPLGGRLRKMVHIPGRLFSVAPWTVQEVPRIFARNERLVCEFETAMGPMVMVLVGAINVAAIETVWSGLVTPPAGKKISEFDYSHTKKQLNKGDEMGRFNMGSTVILLTRKQVEWLPHINAGQPLKMGQLIGHFPPRKARPGN